MRALILLAALAAAPAHAALLGRAPVTLGGTHHRGRRLTQLVVQISGTHQSPLRAPFTSSALARLGVDAPAGPFRFRA